MSTRVTIPLVSTNASDVTITAWRCAPGARVRPGEGLLEVTTDKAAFEVEAPSEGTLLAVYAPPRSVVPVGYIVALLGEPGETDPAVESDNAAIVARQQHALTARDPAADASAAATAGAPSLRSPPPSGTALPQAVRATPKARRLAAERGLDLEAVRAATAATLITEAVLEAYTLASRSQTP